MRAGGSSYAEFIILDSDILVTELRANGDWLPQKLAGNYVTSIGRSELECSRL